VIPRRIHFATLPDADCLRISHFFDAYRTEVQPENPQIPFEERLQLWRNLPEHFVSVDFVLEDQGQVIGIAITSWTAGDENNPDTCWGNLIVAPGFRQRGFGLLLLRRLLTEIAGMGRKTFYFETNEGLNAGEIFAERLGAKRGLEQNTNRLLLSDLNRDYLQRSLEQAPRQQFELGVFDGKYPDSELERLCQLFDILNDAPLGELDLNDEKITPDELRQSLEHERKLGRKRCLIFARDRASGRYAGFTEVEWLQSRPEEVVQNGTAVHADFRGRGLGPWLKSVMIERILREHPQVNQIRTSNADSNVRMVKINDALGFKIFLRRVVWLIDVQETLEHLRSGD
jgi:mycothiol synthase